MYKDILRVLGVAALVGSAGCLPTYEPGSVSKPAPDTEVTGPEHSNTSNEPVAVRPSTPADESAVWMSAGDASALAARAAAEGPIEVASRNHACMKVKFETVGRLLRNLGVELGTLPMTDAVVESTKRTFGIQGISRECGTLASPMNTDDMRFLGILSQSAAFLYCDSRLTLGFPQYGARQAEATTATTASSTKLLDLFLTAAPEIIAANANAQAATANANGTAAQRYKANCQDLSGNVAPLFVVNGGVTECNPAGITCLQGYGATEDQRVLCNRVISQAEATPAQTVSTPNRTTTTSAVSALDNGKRLAVAVVLSSAHSCE